MSEPRRFGFSKKMMELCPGKEVEIAGIPVVFSPLKFGQLSRVIKKFNVLTQDLSDAGVTFDNYNHPFFLAKLVSIALEKSPDLLEEVSDIATEDLQELQFEELLKVVEAVIEVNEESFSSLSKNWQSLTEKLEKLPFVNFSKKPQTPIQ